MARTPDPARTRLLLEKTLGGDADAERSLYALLQGFLRLETRRHQLTKSVRAIASVDDIVSEVWLRICAADSLRSFEDQGPGSLRRFIARILDHVLVDMVRRYRATKRGGSLHTQSLDATQPALPTNDYRRPRFLSSESTPTSNARATELREICQSALDGHEYRIWHDVEVEGHTSEEVAAALGTSSAAIRGVLYRVRAKLIRAMGAHRKPASRS